MFMFRLLKGIKQLEKALKEMAKTKKAFDTLRKVGIL